MTILDHALAYAARGWHVFPLHSADVGGLEVACTCGQAGCTSIAKHPRTRTGVKEASTDRATIEAWWAQWPDANIGLATGMISGLYVVDLDGPEAAAAWADLNVEGGAWVSLTGNGQHHVYALAAPLPSTHWKIATGIDTRGDGGYIVAPPSLHRTGKRYAWSPATDPGHAPIPVPAFVVEACTPRINTESGPPSITYGATTSYGRGVLRNSIARIRAAGEGKRNSTLNDEAFLVGQFVAGGEIDPVGVAQVLEAASTDDDRKKVRSTVQRGLRDGADAPRRAPE